MSEKASFAQKLKDQFSTKSLVLIPIAVSYTHLGYERVYYYEGECAIVAGIGASGFIVSTYPHCHRKEK